MSRTNYATIKYDTTIANLWLIRIHANILFQKVISSAHISFSVFGLAFILVAGFCIVAVSVSIEVLAGVFQRLAKRDQYSRLEWNTNGTLQLQRIAYEELGIGDWAGCDERVPFVPTHIGLPPLDLSDAKHPIIQSPQKSNGNDGVDGSLRSKIKLKWREAMIKYADS